MGTKVHRESYFNHTMRDLNEDLNNCNNWRKCYGGENGTANGLRCYNGFMDKSPTYANPNCEIDALKQRMLEHEALFKAQLHELHRLYKIQRELMEDAKEKKKELQQQISSSSSSLRLPSGGFPLFNSGHTSTCRVEIGNSPLSCTKEYDGLDSRPSKVRKKLFDLHFPAEKYIDVEEEEEEGIDLNEPFRIEEETAVSYMDLDRDSKDANLPEEIRVNGEAGPSKRSVFDPSLNSISATDPSLLVNGSCSIARESPFSGFSRLNCNRNSSDSHHNNVQRRTIDIDLNEVGEEDNSTAQDDVPSLLWLKHKPANKILGIPIFDTNEPTAFSKGHTERALDINLECEPDDEPPLGKENNLGEFVTIDLNSCVVESDGPSSPLNEFPLPRATRILEIDLESSPVHENEDGIEAERCQEITTHDIPLLLQSSDEDHRKAAEAIFAISSSFCCPSVEEEEEDETLPSPENSLLWFADVLSSEEHGSTEEIDDFEAKTLQLREMRGDKEYEARPVVEETGPPGDSSITTGQPRRGQPRRARQRKDFQRDILPGLSTLSRQEVTEDLQTFGGLMRAMGHPWNVGPTRRNGGGARGRRRAVTETSSNDVQSRVFEVPLARKLGPVLEDRSIAGWVKATRRPRRQRCASSGNSNPTKAVLT